MPGMWNHWVARASTPYEPFLEFRSGMIAWIRLKAIFPQLLSAVLMPNHLHILLPSSLEDGFVRRKMSGYLGGISKSLKIPALWQTVPSPSRILDLGNLHRQVRYIALNPCRKKLCKDPLEWYWSTYREVMGATAEKPLIDLANSLGDFRGNFQVRFHHYVSGDPSVSLAGSAFPEAAIPRELTQYGIGEILLAAASALRILPSEIKILRSPLRPLFVHLAYRHGWRQISLLAKYCDMSPRGVHHLLDQVPPAEAIAAADLCLGDRRLRISPTNHQSLAR